MQIWKTISALAIALFLGTGAASAAACYQSHTVPAGSSCAENGGNSVDFTSQCKFWDAYVVQTEVPCPAAWVGNRYPSSSTNTAGKLTCQKAGFAARTNINGAICTSKNLPNGGTYAVQFQYMSQSANNEQMRSQLYCYASKSAATKGSFIGDMNPSDILNAWACGN
ncbi:hypothetical protein [Rhizobium leguminosarum]|uniref:hypothetical protein n=1 Tax=Rhizobium leguminosarum TaxID=384 RepID=UPI002E0F1C41|nr:hypothetical protein U8Q02_36710 [Rhizobium leguminosarum]